MLKKNYISSMRPITAYALGHFRMNFKKVVFFEYLIMFRNFLALVPRGGQAKICGTYADLVGTKKAGLQIFSMVLQIFSMMH